MHYITVDICLRVQAALDTGLENNLEFKTLGMINFHTQRRLFMNTL